MSRKDRRAAGKHAASPRSDVSALFALAVRHHQAGQLFEAESLYRQVLASDKSHFGSLHHLGIVALQRGQAQAALDPISRAIAVNNRVPDCHYNMAFALQALGRLSEAVVHYQHAVKLKPDYVEAHTNLGNALKELGRHGDAASAYERVINLKPSAEAYYNLANTLAQLGRSDEAVTSYRRALTLKPDLAEAHNNLANALVTQDRLQEACTHFQRALALNPGLVEAHVNLGATLLRLGDPAAAADALGHALGIDANFAEAHANLGNVCLAQGRLDEAAERCRHALSLKPDLAEAHNNLGIVLMAQGDFEEAARRFQQALARKPDFVDAYNNLARTFLSMGQPNEALAALERVLATAETAETKSLFVQCVRALPLAPESAHFNSLLIRALSEPWGRANDLAQAAARVIKQDGIIRDCIARVLETWPSRLPARELLDRSTLTGISRHRLLRCLMETASISDIELERLLTAVRFALLEIGCAAAADRGVSDGLVLEDETLEFCCALARQCFLNEQVFARTDEETDKAEWLRSRVAAALASGGAISEPLLALLATYFPLHSLPGADSLASKAWSDPVAGVLVQQVTEPTQERQSRASIPALTPVEDGTSRQVQQQYEENPYPRWLKAEPAGQPLLLDQYLRRRFPIALFANLGKRQIEVLIAGCGTGQHAIETAQRFAGANVLAIDLSLGSLAYAQRKTRELNRSNIEYAQADILQLAALGRSFDLIESSGVLHHLADPLAGWRVLLGLLRPSGFMAIGLYSEIARADIVATRAFIAEQGYGPTAEDIRRCRQDLLDAGERFKNVTASGDFFSTSGCRDLLFHVQEHRLAIPQIAEFIAGNQLAFIGFELDPFTLQRYRAKFPRDATMTDLAHWHAFECEHPATFSGMYQFWVQKMP
jgi:tetratricopeptide (TPR) repeat protein/SAM-dependent methyltransferase